MNSVKDFNSSDLEFSGDEDPQPARRKIGQASIDKIIADAEKDRISSKKTLKKLQFQGAAPSTNYTKSLWVVRFNTFRQQALHQSTETPFTGADLIRFLDSFIGKIQPKGKGKPVPSFDTVQVAYQYLVQYGIFRWSKEDGFGITAHDGAQFKAFMIQAVKEKRLIKGMWYDRTWTGFVTLSRLVRTFLDHFVRYGAWSFDVIIAKCLSVVLVSSLACRSGDASRSQGYTGQEYLQYKHIELYLEEVGVDASSSRKPQFQDLRAVVTLDYCKGYKDQRNVSQVRHLSPLDIQSVHVCPIALLLVHALRHGLVHGTNLEEVLAHTAAQPDLHVKWKYPERPVLIALSRRGTRCDPDTAAGSRQVLETIKLMGLISGMLSRVYAHSLRLGAVRDYTHMSRTATQASLPTTDDTRRFVGHTFKSMQKGTTDKYAGDLALDFYNARAENGGVHHSREPKFAISGGEEAHWNIVKEPLRADEIQAYVDEHMPGREPGSLTRAEQRTMGDRIRRGRAEALGAEPRAARPQTASNIGVAAPEVPLPPRYPAPDPPPSPAQHTKATTSGEAVTGTASKKEDPQFLSMIDPALLDDESLASINVADADVDALQDVIMLAGGGTEAEDGDGGAEDQARGAEEGVAPDPAAVAGQDNDIEEAAHLLLGQEEPNGGTGYESHAGWIDGYARYNIVNNQKFAIAWKQFSEGQGSFEDSIGAYSVRGDSRDEPTPYVFHCRRTEGCNYSSILKGSVDAHELGCRPELVERKAKEGKEGGDEKSGPDADVLKCAHPGCAFQTSKRKTLNQHVRDKHDFTPKAYEDCDDGVIYQTAATLRNHRTNVHSGRWPSRCLFPGCPVTTEFSSQNALVRHLRKNHGLSTPESYSPYLPPYPAKERWVKQECVVTTCTNKTLYAQRCGMIRHLKDKHGMDDTEAKELVDREARVETVVHKARVLQPAGSNSSNKRPSNQKTSLAAPGKENDPPAAGPESKKPRLKKN